MNTWQCLRQVKYLLLARNWTGSNNKVFASEAVIITANPEIHTLATARAPIVILKPGEGTMDPEYSEEHELIARTIHLTLIASIANDPGTGEASIMGANRTSGNTHSYGRGLLELEEEVNEAIKHLDPDNGIFVQHKTAGIASVSQVEAGGQVLYVQRMDWTFDLFTNTNRSYPEPINLVATGLSAGSVYLTWDLPPARYDRLSVILRRASGSTAPTSVTGGTGVTLSGALATSVTDAPGSGTWSYALFAAYDESSATPTTADRYSDPATATASTL
jgi:hypothetical protein